MILFSRVAACAGIALVYCSTALPAPAQSAPDSTRDTVSVAPAARPADSVAKIQLPSLTLVTAHEVDRMRANQLAKGVAPGQSLLLRSASSLATPPALGKRWIAGELIYPQLLFVRNSGLPFSQNNSSLWAGRGISTRALLGFRLEAPHFSFVFAPQVVASENSYWLTNHNYFQPLIPLSYIGRGFTFPYYFYTFPIDQPLSFGSRRIRSFDLGESTALLHAGGVQLGISNENQWWGPGIRNAMLLSNNAPGFPHVFLRTGRPIMTPAGGLELRWLAGALTESRYFDSVSTNDTRSLAAIGAALQMRWDPNLTIGFARSVYATAEKWEQIPGRLGDVFKGATQANSEVLADIAKDKPITLNGRDQLFSLFARWVFPSSGAEVYSEWGRTRPPKSVSDFLKTPNHTQGYTIGMQWRGEPWGGGTVRGQAEVTQLEQSATFRDGPVGSWYTSNRVLQGYTNRGHIIGASIGPGASSQFVALDYLKSSWQLGAFAGRIRWNEDVHSTFGFPDFVSYCNHDVSIYPGLRGALFGGFGSISAELTLQNRLNLLFQNKGGCPNNGVRLDLRTTSLKVGMTAFKYR